MTSAGTALTPLDEALALLPAPIRVVRPATTTHELHDLADLLPQGALDSSGPRRIRVCVVETILQTGGAEWFAAQLALSANPSVFEFVFLLWKADGSSLAAHLAENGVPVLSSVELDPQSVDASVWRKEGLFRLLGRLQPDITFFPSQYLFGQLDPERLSAFNPVVRISNFHDTLSGEGLGHAERVFCATEEQLAAMAALDADKVVLIPTGTNTELFAIAETGQRQALRERLGLTAEHVVLFVGRLSAPLKRLDVFQEVVRAIRAERADVQFLVVGYFESHAHSDEDIFRAFVEEQEVGWVEGVDPWEMPDLYRAADVLLSTSAIDEGLSNTVLQALASGTTPVVTPSSGMGDLVTDGVTGFLAADMTTASITSALTLALDLDPLSRQELVRNGRSRIVEHFDFATCSRKYQKQLLALHRARPTEVCVTDGYFDTGGAEWLVALLILNSDPKSVRFRLVSHRGQGSLARWLRDRGVQVLEAPAEASYSQWRERWAAAALKAVRPDVVMPCTITTWPLHEPFYRLLMISQNASDARVLSTDQYDLADHIICVSDDVKQQLSADHHWKMSVLHNSIDVAMFSPNEASRQTARARLGISAEAQVVLWCARLHEPRKRMDVLMDVIRGTDDPATVFLVVGYFRGDEGDQERWNQLLETQDNVAWVRDCSPWETPEYYAAADAFLSTSGFTRGDFEGLSLATAQALATCLPVVSTMSGGQHELVEQGRNGFLVEPGDAEGLAKSLDRVFALPSSERSAMAGRNREKAVASFDITRHADAYGRLVSLLKNVVGPALLADPLLLPANSLDPASAMAESFRTFTWPLVHPWTPPDGAPVAADDTFGFLADLAAKGPVVVLGDEALAAEVSDVVGEVEMSLPAQAAAPPAQLVVLQTSRAADDLRSLLRKASRSLADGGWIVLLDVGPHHRARAEGRASADGVMALLDHLEIEWPTYAQCRRMGGHLLLEHR